MLELFLSPSDAERAIHTFDMLAQHDTSEWVLTGGLAVEFHCLLNGAELASRDLNDIDFTVDRFDVIPASLSSDLIFRHLHPHDPTNKTLVQAVFPQAAVRIDVFRSAGGILSRSRVVEIAGRTQRIISIEDLTARSARLSLDLAEDQPTPAKHARDFLRLLPYVMENNMVAAWADHRKPSHPAAFFDGAKLLQKIIPARAELLVVPDYSHDCESKCARCEPTPCFPLAQAEIAQSLLGYC